MHHTGPSVKQHDLNGFSSIHDYLDRSASSVIVNIWMVSRYEIKETKQISTRFLQQPYFQMSRLARVFREVCPRVHFQFGRDFFTIFLILTMESEMPPVVARYHFNQHLEDRSGDLGVCCLHSSCRFLHRLISS